MGSERWSLVQNDASVDQKAMGYEVVPRRERGSTVTIKHVQIRKKIHKLQVE
jgi:hypothetical protein